MPSYQRQQIAQEAPKHLKVLLFYAGFLFFSNSKPAIAQYIEWQNQIGHPRYSGNKVYYYESLSNGAFFQTRFFVPSSGYAPYNSLYGLAEYCYLQQYDYSGNLLSVDTIRGMSSGGPLYKTSDSTFILSNTLGYVRPGQIPYDTGQNGGYMFRQYTTSGRILWEQRWHEDSPSSIVSLFPSSQGRFIVLGDLGSSFKFEYYTKEGFLERAIDYPLSLNATGKWTYLGIERGFLVNRFKILGTTNSALYTVAHLDSSLSLIREDTIGTLGQWYANEEIIPMANGGYISLIPQRSDTLRTRLFIFDGIKSKPINGLISDSGQIYLIPLSDGGVLSFETKYITNLQRIVDSLYNLRKSYYGRTYFQRLDSSWKPKWRVDISESNSDSITYKLFPTASIPDSPNDAIYYGTRVVSSPVKTEPRGTFALVGRINGVGNIFNPTAVRGPRARPAPLEAVLYPNPAQGFVQLQIGKALPYKILTITGAVVQEGMAYPKIPIDIAALPPALYQLILTDGQQKVVRRFVKN